MIPTAGPMELQTLVPVLAASRDAHVGMALLQALAKSPSVFTLTNGMRVFAGPRDDAFYFDSAATFDTLNFRSPAPVLTGQTPSSLPR